MIRVMGLFLILLMVTGQVLAQNITTHLSNHEKRGDKLFYHFSYLQAMEAYKNVPENKSSDAIKLKIAECYRLLNDTKNTAEWYAKVIKNDEVVSSIHKLYYAEALASNGDYDNAKVWYQEFRDEVKEDRRGLNKFEGLGNIDKFYVDSAAYKIENTAINTPLADFAPMYHDNGLVFVSERASKGLIKSVYNRREQSFLDLFYSKFDEGGQTTKPRIFHKKVNTKFHEGPVTFYNDDQNIIFTRNNYYEGKERKSEDGINKLKLFSAEKSSGGGWTNIQSLPFNNDEYSVGHPAVSPDGKTLYFASDMPGGIGKTDLYVAYFEDDTWTTPQNLGPEINTEGDEMFPFLSDEGTLYYASNGWPGLGGLDIFKSEVVEEGYTPPYNLGFPINSSQDDFALVISPEGDMGHFSSRRLGGAGDDDIYKVFINRANVEVEPGVDLEKIAYEVMVVDEQTGQELFTQRKNGKLVFKGIPGRTYNLVAIINNSSISRENIPIEADLKPPGMKRVKLPAKFWDEKGKIISEEPDYQVYAVKDAEKSAPQENLNALKQEDLRLIEVDSGKEIPFELGDQLISFEAKPESRYMLRKLKGDNTTDLMLIQTKDEPLKMSLIAVPLVDENQESTQDKMVVMINNSDKVQYFLADSQGNLEAIPSLKNLPAETSSGNKKQNGLFVINNIYYDLDKYSIREEARAELDKIVGLMNKYLNIHLVLTSHTDSRANDSYNARLSEKRSRAVTQYLAKHQVVAARITANHKGEKQLVNDCLDGKPCPEDKHQLNRRTEFKLIINQ